MVAIHSLSVSALSFALLLAGDASAAAIDTRLSLSAYAPIHAICPTTALVRPASGISSKEATYISKRETKASADLAAWLNSTKAGFDTCKLPLVGLTSSGGGYRALLNGAGVIQGLDARDSSVSTSGLFQGLTYQAGLSGGGWLLSSFAGNNYPTISMLKTSLWETAFEDSLLDPAELLVAAAYSEVVSDIEAKDAAGYEPTMQGSTVDCYQTP